MISGVKAIVTGGPYMHELLVMPCRTMRKEDADFAICCAVPIDAKGLTIISRPAGRPGEAEAAVQLKVWSECGGVPLRSGLRALGSGFLCRRA